MKPSYRALLVIILCLIGGVFSLLLTLRTILPEEPVLDDRISFLLKSCEESAPKGTSNHPGYYSCLRKEFYPLIKNRGVEEFMNSLSGIFLRTGGDSFGNSSCHDISHIVGEEASGINNNLGEVIIGCGETCGYGCTHGAALSFLRQHGNLQEGIGEACKNPAIQASPHYLIACNHGLGHGLADIANWDTAKALELCNYLGGDAEREQCATGVFMEIFTAPGANHPPVPIPEDFNGFCNSLPDYYRKNCYHSAGSLTYQRTHEIDEAFLACNQVPDDFTDGCIVAFGSDLYFLFTDNPSKALSSCMESQRKDQEACMRGVVYSSFVNVPDGEWAMGFCALSEDDILRSKCNEYASRQLSEVGKAQGNK